MNHAKVGGPTNIIENGTCELGLSLITFVSILPMCDHVHNSHDDTFQLIYSVVSMLDISF